MATRTETNRYSSACVVLQLGGATVGFLRTAEGGEPVGQVSKEPVDANGAVKKHIASTNYQPIVMTFGAGMDPSVYQWMTDTLDRKPSAKSGAIIFGDQYFKEKFRLEFDNALPIAIGFPAADAKSQDAAVFTLTLQPQVTRVNAASLGSFIQGFSTKAKKHWLVSNFRFKISGLESACAKVNAVDALTVTQTAGAGDKVKPGPLNIPDIAFTVAESGAQDILHWADDFLVKGNNDQASERSGTLEFLDTSLKKVLFTLRFSNLGIIQARRLRIEEPGGVIARFAVQLYCEQMTFAPDKDALGAAVPSTSGSASQPGTNTGTVASVLLTDTLINIIAGRLTPESALQSLNANDATQASPPTAVTASEIVARRLLTTVRAVPTGPIVPKWNDGVALGEQWARDTATIDELNVIRTINQDDWSALNLEAGHSLVEALRGQGMIPDGADGPLQLDRDAFVEGIVAGAIQVLSNASPHLTRLADAVSPATGA
jgi:hypothetical protein